MHFHVHIIKSKQFAKGISHVNTHRYFGQHPLFDAHFLPGNFIVYIHETTFSFPDKNDNGCKFSDASFHLAISTDTRFYFIAAFFFTYQCIPYFIADWLLDDVAIKFSPLLFHFFYFLKSLLFLPVLRALKDSPPDRTGRKLPCTGLESVLLPITSNARLRTKQDSPPDRTGRELSTIGLTSALGRLPLSYVSLLARRDSNPELQV